MRDAIMHTTVNGGEWCITTDYIYDEQTPDNIPNRLKLKKYFKLYDDGECYFDGLFDMNKGDTGLEPLEYAQNIYGCTEIRYFNTETQAWEKL